MINLKPIRKLRGYTFKSLAAKTGISPRQIFNYEQGGDITLSKLKKLAHVLEVHINDLIIP